VHWSPSCLRPGCRCANDTSPDATFNGQSTEDITIRTARSWMSCALTSG
jgi:hypothetical protein